MNPGEPDPQPDEPDEEQQLGLWDGLDDTLDLGAWMETLPKDEQLPSEQH